jgi:WD40 repeat protein
MPQPALLLAFANDHDPQGRYLAGLATELRAVRQVLEPGENAGRWRVVERTNTTIDDLLDAFDAHGGEVVALHYGGHAAGYGLLLESTTGHPRLAHAGGLARFLGQQTGLRVVFLNGCSTRGQVRDLLAAGVPAVIATEREIEDDVAVRFASRFYRALARGATLGAAFDEARGAVEADRGAPGAPDASASARSIDVSGDDDGPAGAEFPWLLHVADGAERSRDWHLGLASGDPLFGLPPLPPTDLPAEPFVHLQWFGAEHAPLFFGRGAEIRLLYDRVTAPDAPPITLLYGQSGAGKSSLLAAGLLPRLRATHLAAYLRRDEALGLSGALRKALALGAGAPLPADAWRALEARLGRPVVIVIDQLEEAFTRPRGSQASGGAPPPSPTVPPPESSAGTIPTPPPAGGTPAPAAPPGAADPADAELRALYGLPAAAPPPPPPPAVRDELGALVADLVTLFRDAAARPAGRLVLGFRKEWLAEVRARLVDARLPFGEVFLDRLGRAGVVEAVTGPAREPALRAKYGLTLEDGLAEVIADDLLVDPDAPVAPTLQVLLAKLWRAAPPGRDGARAFDRRLYQPLKDAGILLGDFLDQQLAALGSTHAAESASGLALDVLAFHTTAHRTARTCTRAELLEAYPHAAESLPGLLERCAELYLLLEPNDDVAGAARLSHDTLAPLVRDRHHASDRPAQRALRIVESRAAEWSGGRVGRLLDDVDLATVEAGAAGMRAWTADERRLVDASRAAARARWAERALAEADAEADPAEAARLLARLADDPEPPNGLAVAGRIARRAIPLAVIDVTRLRGDRSIGRVRELAFSADDGALLALGERGVARLGGWRGVDGPSELLMDSTEVAPDSRAPATLAADGRRVAMVTSEGTLVWRVGAWDSPLNVQQPEVNPRHASHPDVEPPFMFASSLWFGADSRSLVTTGDVVRVFDLEPFALRASVPGGSLCSVALSGDGRWLAVWGLQMDSALYELMPGGEAVRRLSLGTPRPGRGVGMFIFDAASRLVAAKPYGEFPRLWRLDDLDAAPREFPDARDAHCLAFNPRHPELAAGGGDGSLHAWHHTGEFLPDVIRAHDHAIERIAHDADGRLLLTVCDDATAKLWEEPFLIERAAFHGHRGAIGYAAFSHDGALVATVGERDAVRVWSTDGPIEPLLLQRHRFLDGELDDAHGIHQEGYRRPIHVAPDGLHFAIAALDGSVRATALVGEPLTHTLRVRAADARTPLCLALGVADGVMTAVLADGAVLRAPADEDVVLPTPVRAAGAPLSHAAVSRDGRTVAVRLADEHHPEVHLWSLDGARPDLVLPLEALDVSSLQLSPDGRHVAVSAWSPSLGALIYSTERGGDPESVCADTSGSVAFSPDGARVAGALSDGRVGVWQVGGARDPVVVLDAGQASGAPMAFVAGALVTACDDASVAVCPLDGGPRTRVHTGHDALVQHLEPSADGRLVLTVAEDGSARVCRLDGVGAPLELLAGREVVRSAAFTPDGRRVIARDDDGIVRVWSVAWDDLVRRVRDAAG